MPIDPLTAGTIGISIGSSLLGSLFGGDGRSKGAKFAENELIKLARSGIPPEILRIIIERAMKNVQIGVNQGQQGVRARAAAGGLDISSGLVGEQLSGVQRSGLQQRGQISANVQLQSQQQKLQALQSLLGQPRNANNGKIFAELPARVSKKPSLLERGCPSKLCRA